MNGSLCLTIVLATAFVTTDCHSQNYEDTPEYATEKAQAAAKQQWEREHAATSSNQAAHGQQIGGAPTAPAAKVQNREDTPEYAAEKAREAARQQWEREYRPFADPSQPLVTFTPSGQNAPLAQDGAEQARQNALQESARLFSTQQVPLDQAQADARRQWEQERGPGDNIHVQPYEDTPEYAAEKAQAAEASRQREQWVREYQERDRLEREALMREFQERENLARDQWTRDFQRRVERSQNAPAAAW